MTEFKLGCLPPVDAPKLMFSDFWTGAMPEIPDAADFMPTSGWQMLGNDRLGDCVAVACANLTRHITSKLGPAVDYPTYDEVIQLYRTQNPGNSDNGMVIQYCLDWWLKNSWSGRKIIAYAAVNPRDLNQIKAAIAIFGGVIPGVTVTSGNMQQFNQGKPWDAVGGNGGGHAILCGGYSGDANDAVDFITWAKKTTFTERFIQKQWNECWVVIIPEHLSTASFQVGVNGQKLADAYKSLTGKTLVVPPLPEPPSPPNPPAPSSLEKQVSDLSQKVDVLSASVTMLAQMIGSLRK